MQRRTRAVTETLTATVDLLDGMAFGATSGTGHEVFTDAALVVGGSDRGARPMELLLVGFGGCTGMDVISMLRTMRQDVSGYSVQIHGDRAGEHRKVFTCITIEHVVAV